MKKKLPNTLLLYYNYTRCKPFKINMFLKILFTVCYNQKRNNIISSYL
jgi:hypothetical protein